GLGAALNTLSNFNETEASPGGGIAPPANQFHDHSELSLAYEFGLGVQRQFLSKPHQNLFLALEYRYLNWGKMGLSAADLQPTANAIQYNSSPGHLFDLGLIWQFK
ncbi:MAG: hypothetical protein EBX40_06680, partial [Gammaproteobacteria bacterium]|nr:hypothetical protein [Gammaproteobacteria bacterium]